MSLSFRKFQRERNLSSEEGKIEFKFHKGRLLLSAVSRKIAQTLENKGSENLDLSFRKFQWEQDLSSAVVRIEFKFHKGRFLLSAVSQKIVQALENKGSGNLDLSFRKFHKGRFLLP